LGTIAAMMTAFYSFRLIHLTYITDFNGSQNLFKNSHESPWQMTLPLFIFLHLILVVINLLMLNL
jgi:NADH:ubiquinone oxidoreductase subunit 5 (subunit L)/multisubunit Na+/H+ antiporter MnhA subunit